MIIQIIRISMRIKIGNRYPFAFLKGFIMRLPVGQKMIFGRLMGRLNIFFQSVLDGEKGFKKYISNIYSIKSLLILFKYKDLGQQLMA